MKETNRKQGKQRKMKENQWKMKGKPIQTEKQKKSPKKNKKKFPKKIRTLFLYEKR